MRKTRRGCRSPGGRCTDAVLSLDRLRLQLIQLQQSLLDLKIDLITARCDNFVAIHIVVFVSHCCHLSWSAARVVEDGGWQLFSCLQAAAYALMDQCPWKHIFATALCDYLLLLLDNLSVMKTRSILIEQSLEHLEVLFSSKYFLDIFRQDLRSSEVVIGRWQNFVTGSQVNLRHSSRCRRCRARAQINVRRPADSRHLVVLHFISRSV